MPKAKKSKEEFLFGIVKDFKNEFKTDVQFGQKVLFCIVCECVVKVDDNRLSLVIQHRRTKGHVAGLEKRGSLTASVSQELVTNSLIPIESRHAEFHSDITRAFVAGKFSFVVPITLVFRQFPLNKCEMLNVEYFYYFSADIPLHKIQNDLLRNFLTKYIGRPMPQVTTLRRCLPNLYQETIADLRKKVVNQFIWVALDETIDAENRSVANFVFGILGNESEKDKSYLLTVEELERVNHSTVAAFFNNALTILYPEGRYRINKEAILPN